MKTFFFHFKMPLMVTQATNRSIVQEVTKFEVHERVKENRVMFEKARWETTIMRTLPKIERSSMKDLTKFRSELKPEVVSKQLQKKSRLSI